jgi:hypothetical protein
MTQRELLIEDMQGMETILCALDDNCTERCMTERQVIRGIARALWHILTWIVKRIDDERRNA